MKKQTAAVSREEFVKALSNLVAHIVSDSKHPVGVSKAQIRREEKLLHLIAAKAGVTLTRDELDDILF